MWPRDEDGIWDTGGDGCSTVPSIVVELTWEELVYLESVAKNFTGQKSCGQFKSAIHTLFFIPGCYFRGDACGATYEPCPVHRRMAGVPVWAEEGRCGHTSCCRGKLSPDRRTPSCRGFEQSSASPSAGSQSPPPSLLSGENSVSIENLSKPPTEISSSLFKSGSSSLKTERKSRSSRGQ